MHNRRSQSSPVFRSLGWFVALMAVLGSAPLVVFAQVDGELEDQINELVASLDADTVSERDLAETNLMALSQVDGVGIEKFLSLLPQPHGNMPPAVQDRLRKIRRALEDELARASIKGTHVQLEAVNWKLSEVLEELEKQSGNKVIDGRQQRNQPAENPTVLIVTEKVPFWAALDQVLDEAKLSVNNYTSQDGVSLVERPADAGPRYGRASYTGPFRCEVTEVSAIRGLRLPTTKRLQLDLEIAWEPRLRPIAISQPLDLVEAVDESGNALTAAQPGRVFQIEVQQGVSATTISLPFELPERSVGAVARLRGAMTALVAGQQHEFRFDNLTSPTPITQSFGGVHVTLDRVVKNNDLWEVHMRMKLEGDNHALESHRGWVFSNINYLVDEAGETIEYAGLETTRQSENEVGIAYVYDIEHPIDKLAWVYKSPVAIVEQQFEYELESIPLP